MFDFDDVFDFVISIFKALAFLLVLPFLIIPYILYVFFGMFGGLFDRVRLFFNNFFDKL